MSSLAFLQQRVQIPPWFDANQNSQKGRGIPKMFKFHRGSMQTQGMRCRTTANKKVQIPPWFDANAVRRPVSSYLQKGFKFHRGSMQTIQPRHVGRTFFSVQIPPWFDANVAYPVVLTEADKVQIPPWFDANSTVGNSSFRSVSVQIPPWFDANQLLGTFLMQQKLGFKFHRGSMQTETSTLFKDSSTTFKFHRGSMQTRWGQLSLIKRRQVQIPPWFDANLKRDNS